MKLKFENLKSKIKTAFNKNKKLFITSLILVVVLILTVFFLPTSENKTTHKKQTSEDNVSTSKDSYVSCIEEKIQTMLLSINEITKANVMVLCESSEIVEYLKNKDETISSDGNKTSSEDVAYKKDGSNTSPIIVSTKMPKIIGVWIIINSVSASTKLSITNSISSVLNIDETSISILQER